MKHSTDYHDYVFKDNKCIGKFEEMYKYSSEIPWHQDKTAYLVFSDLDIAILKQLRYGSICEVGCGYGYFTNRLYRELSSKKGRPEVTGIDVSSAAIKKAKDIFPEIRFVKGNLIKERPLKGEHFELVLIKDILWYNCHKLQRFMHNLTDMIKDGGYLYVSNSFPDNNKKWVGMKVIDKPEILKKILMQYTKPIHYCLDFHDPLYKNGHVHFLGKKIKNKSLCV